jgi:hypothetical protein
MDEDLCDVLKRRANDCYDDECYDGRRFVADKPNMRVKSVEPWPQTQHYWLYSSNNYYILEAYNNLLVAPKSLRSQDQREAVRNTMLENLQTDMSSSALRSDL